jgi:hypothetical protein
VKSSINMEYEKMSTASSKKWLYEVKRNLSIAPSPSAADFFRINNSNRLHLNTASHGFYYARDSDDVRLKNLITRTCEWIFPFFSSRFIPFQESHNISIQQRSHVLNRIEKVNFHYKLSLRSQLSVIVFGYLAYNL